MKQERFSDRKSGSLVRVVLHKHRTTAGGITEIDDVESWSFVPDPLPPKIEWGALKGRLYSSLESAAASLGRVNGVVTLTHNARTLLRALWLREAKLSSEIEGIHTTAIDMVLAESQAHRAESSKAVEVWNAVKALEYGLGSDLPWSGRLIREMHAVLLSGVRGDDKRPGEYRNSPVYIGTANDPQNARFVPPSGIGEHSIASLLSSLEAFVHQTPSEIPALVAIALEHYQFESIHPFRDGNGRIGRALVVLQMCRRNLLDQPVVFLSGYFERNKREYVDRLLAVSTDGDWEGWIRFFLDAVIDQSRRTVVLAERLVRMREKQIEQIRSANAPSRLLVLVDHLFERPVVSARSVSERLSVTDPTARKDIATLVGMDILRPASDANYGQVWYAPSVLTVIEEAEQES